jgi:hypothetical protein
MTPLQLTLSRVILMVVSFAAGPSLAGEIPSDRAMLLFGREWIAYSSSAIDATGDVRLSPTAVTFEHRVTFKLRYVSTIDKPPAENNFRGVADFLLFEFINPRSRPIRNGNHLGGHPKYAARIKLPQYLAVGIERRQDEDRLTLVIFFDWPPPLQENGAWNVYNSYGYFISTSDPPRQEDGPARHTRALQNSSVTGSTTEPSAARA